MEISKLDRILADVRNRNIRTMEARVKILELIEDAEQLRICAVVQPSAEKVCEHPPERTSFNMDYGTTFCGKCGCVINKL